MHALVFAAGRGTRLRPYTDATPKPLLEIGGNPLLERTLNTVVDAGVEAIVIVVGYRADEITDAIGTAVDDVPVRYAVQNDQQGLAHAVCTAFEDGYGVTDPTALSDTHRDVVPDDVVTVNGDNVFDSDCTLSRLIDRHHEPDVDGTLLLDRVARNEAETAARCVLDNDGTVRSLESTTDAESGVIAAGVQTHDARALFRACQTVERSDTGEYELTDALESLLAGGRRYVGVELEGWHLNINTPADLDRARNVLERPQ
ncbi:sugar phosphate nucleotidyltransferase [Natronorubrum bangense]|uniref:Nucleotidyl transferase n=2 Tax=Natronorubrum bangense TaxID=61858 RepID=L9WP14_9EURY|nr:sugar phosphate nucleotidyltransferase [Natronorubrum bangense]ELY51240.1 nucleotidyl transferase [Natronorubrum bangense JCM 10635]QCC54768.1 nucleotidyl transferase [Natronorubrum bangense]